MKKGFSFIVFFSTILIIGIFLVGYGYFFWKLPAKKSWIYLTSEGNFPQAVAITGITGYLIYKFFDSKNKFAESFGAIAAMIAWFLWMSVVKFLLR